MKQETGETTNNGGQVNKLRSGSGHGQGVTHVKITARLGYSCMIYLLKLRGLIRTRYGKQRKGNCLQSIVSSLRSSDFRLAC
jgi:hypothetical protein